MTLGMTGGPLTASYFALGGNQYPLAMLPHGAIRSAHTTPFQTSWQTRQVRARRLGHGTARDRRRAALGCTRSAYMIRAPFTRPALIMGPAPK